jgi:hypothetical protein
MKTLCDHFKSLITGRLGYKYEISKLKKLLCGVYRCCVAKSAVRWPAVWRSRVQTPDRHPREVFPSERRSNLRKEGPQHECDYECTKKTKKKQ